MTTSQEVLDCPMAGNDAGATTVRGYLVELLATVWREGEGFSGKRPFGNGGWEYEVYGALGKAGLIDCAFDEDGYIDHLDPVVADALVLRAIQSLGGEDDVSE